MKLNSYMVGASIFIVLAAFFIGANILGVWKTDSTKVPAKYLSGDAAGQYNPADIRGSYSFQDIEDSFKVEGKILLEAFGFDITKDPAIIMVKDLENLYVLPEGKELGTDSVRLFVALYLGLPYTPEETTVLPSQSKNTLKQKLTDEEFNTIKPLFLNPDEDANTLVETEEVKTSDTAEIDKTIKGSTTFSDVITWGLDKQKINDTVGKTNWTTAETIRDWCLKEGIEFSTVKTKLQELLTK